MLTDAQGGTLQVQQAVRLKFQMHGKQIEHVMHVLPSLSQSCILGIDFISKFLTIIGPTKEIHVGSDPFSWSALPAKVHAKTIVPANSQAKILCQVRPPQGMKLIPGSTVFAHESSIDGLSVVDGLYKILDRNAVYIVVANSSHFDFHVGKNAILTRVQNSEGARGCELNDETVGSILAQGAGAIHELCDAAEHRPPLSDEKRSYLIEHLNLSQVPAAWKDAYLQLLLDNHDVFAADKYDLGWTDAVSHRINMRHNRPIYQRQFPIPQAHEEAIHEHIRELLAKRVIEECSSPYNTPIFAVAKKSGGLRVVQDFREINRASFEDKYSIRDVRDCIDAIGKSNSDVFSTLDLASGFWQQHLEPESRAMTAFTVPSLNKQFQWCCTAMGLQGAPASFSRLTAKVFAGDERSLTYIDDVLGHTRGHDAHLAWLEHAFQRLRRYGLKLNAKKCVFGAKEVTYLGFNVSAHGVSPEKDKVAAIKQLRPPRTVKEVKEFVGFCNYFRSMVPHFHQRAAPLFDLTKAASSWSRGALPPKAHAAFLDLQASLGSAPVVSYPDFNKEFVLAVDAATGSPEVRGGLGAVLTQPNGDGTDSIVAYWSRGLRDHETRYTPYNLEMAAIVGAVDHFHTYLYGRRFTVVTDHKPLVGAAVKQEKTFSRLNEKLQMYDCEVVYRKAEQNKGPDFLSRNASSVEAVSGWLGEQTKHEPLQDLANFISSGTVAEDKAEFIRHYGPKSFIKDDTLWYFAPVPRNSGLPPEPVAWVPLHKVDEIIARHHGTALAGHWAVQHTLRAIAAKYFWPTMARDIAAFIAACTACQMADKRTPRAPLQPWEAPSGPFQRVHIDLYGPLVSLGSKKYVAVLTDAFSKWVEVEAIPDKGAQTVAELVYAKWVCRFGAMRKLVSDGGKEFANAILARLLELLEVDKVVNSPYHPEANGQVERFNRDMGGYLARMSSDTADWEAFLPSLALAHNAAVNRSTNHSPFFLLFGRQPRLPGDMEKPFTSSESTPHELFRRLQAAHQWVMRNNEAARASYKAYYDKKAAKPSFTVGDQILVHFPPDPKLANKKLHRPWRGVFIVADVPNDNNIKFVKDPGGKVMSAHVNRVKHFHMLTPPAMIRQVETHGATDNEVNGVADSTHSSAKAPTQLELELFGQSKFSTKRRGQVSFDPPVHTRAAVHHAMPAAHVPQADGAVREDVSLPPSPIPLHRQSVSSEDNDGEQHHFRTPPGSPTLPPTVNPTAPPPPLPAPTPLQVVAQDLFQPRRTRHSGLRVDEQPWVLPKAI